MRNIIITTTTAALLSLSTLAWGDDVAAPEPSASPAPAAAAAPAVPGAPAATVTAKPRSRWVGSAWLGMGARHFGGSAYGTDVGIHVGAELGARLTRSGNWSVVIATETVLEKPKGYLGLNSYGAGAGLRWSGPVPITLAALGVIGTLEQFEDDGSYSIEFVPVTGSALLLHGTIPLKRIRDFRLGLDLSAEYRAVEDITSSSVNASIAMVF